jgi:hypothetical protein
MLLWICQLYVVNMSQMHGTLSLRLVALFEHPVYTEFFISSHYLGILLSSQMDRRHYLSLVGDLLSLDPLHKLRPSDKTFGSHIVCSLTFPSNVSGGGLQCYCGISSCGDYGVATILLWETRPIFVPAICTREKHEFWVKCLASVRRLIWFSEVQLSIITSCCKGYCHRVTTQLQLVIIIIIIIKQWIYCSMTMITDNSWNDRLQFKKKLTLG